MCYHYYAGEDHGNRWGDRRVQTCRLTLLSLAALPDWFMSLGVGLLTFASLETVGIYFGLGKLPPSPPPTHRLFRGGDWTPTDAHQGSESHHINIS